MLSPPTTPPLKLFGGWDSFRCVSALAAAPTSFAARFPIRCFLSGTPCPRKPYNLPGCPCLVLPKLHVPIKHSLLPPLPCSSGSAVAAAARPTPTNTSSSPTSTCASESASPPDEPTELNVAGMLRRINTRRLQPVPTAADAAGGKAPAGSTSITSGEQR